MLRKAKLKIAAWGITGLMGAGSLFSGLAAQNAYAQETAEVGSVNENIEDSVNTEITDQITETQESDSDTSSDTSQSDSVTDGNEGNTPSESPKKNSTAIENGTETERPEEPFKESSTGSDTQNNDDAKEFSGTGAIKDTKAVEAKKNGWVKVKGGYKYYKNGKAYTGWHKMGKAEGEKKTHWSYFGKNGVMYTGWKKMGKAEGEKTAHWCYFGSNGWMRTGWVQLGKGTANPDGNVKKHWSYFGSNGWLRTGWVQLGKGTANPDGNVKKHWSYFGSNGWLRTGWVQLGKGTSEPDGNVTKHWSYFGNNGWMRTGWIHFGKGTSEPDGNVAKHWSFFGENGWMRTGLQNMGKGTSNPDGNSAKHQSYFGNNGWLRVSQNVTVNGKNYKADKNGWLKEIKSFGIKKIVSDISKMNYGTFKDRYGDLGFSHTHGGHFMSDKSIPGTNYYVEFYQPHKDGIIPLTRDAYMLSVTAPLSDIFDGIENVSTVDEFVKLFSSSGKAKAEITIDKYGNWHRPRLTVTGGEIGASIGFNDFNGMKTIPYIAPNLIVELVVSYRYKI